MSVDARAHLLALHHQPPTPWQRLLQTFVVLMPFLHAFGLGTWGPLPLVFAMLIMLLGLLAGAAHWIWLQKSDMFLFGTIGCGVIAIIANFEYAGAKNFNHTAALLVTVTVFYVWMRAWLLSSHISLERLGAAATLGLMVSSLAIIFEFWSSNGPGFFLADVIPYSTEELPFATVLGDYRRPRGLAAEPGFSAMVFEGLGPLAFLYLRSRRSMTMLCAPFILLGFALTFSAGGICALLVAALILASLGRGAAFKWLAGVIGLGVALLLVFGWQSIVEITTELVGRKIVGLFVEGDIDMSDAARYEAYRGGFAMFGEYPNGIGWGMVAQMFDSGRVLEGVPILTSRGLLSLYLEILVSAGVAGLLLYGIFHGLKIGQLARSRQPHASTILFGLLTLSLHHAFLLEYWFPMIWFYFALSDVLNVRDKAGIVQSAGRAGGGTDDTLVVPRRAV